MLPQTNDTDLTVDGQKEDDPRLLEILQKSIDTDEVSSLMDVTQDILNFKGNLVQTDRFRMANKPDRIICNVLYYEVLDDPQVDWAHKKPNVSIGYPYQEASVVLPRRSRVKDLLNDIKPKMKLTNSSAELRLLGIHNHKIYKFFHVEEKIEDIPDEAYLWVDEVLEENLVPGCHLISVYHFTEMVNGVIVKFGEPFLLVFCKDDTLAKVKGRINEKLCVDDEKFSKWKFALLHLGRLRYLEDNDVLYNCFEGKNDVLAQYLGLEHTREHDEVDDWMLTFEVVSSDQM